MYYIKCRKKDNKSSNKIYFQNINLPCCRKTSSWSSMPSRSSSNGLSFFTNAYTYFANAAGSASQLKKVYNSYLFTTYEQPLDYLIIVTNKCVALYLYKHLYSLVYFYSLCTLFTLWLPNKVQCVYFFLNSCIYGHQCIQSQLCLPSILITHVNYQKLEMILF